MQATEQGTHPTGQQRYQTIPRVLLLLTSYNPQTGAQELLLLLGAPGKRLWANKYNGPGGHVEAHENIYAAAARECVEETGLSPAAFEPPGLTLRGVVNINTQINPGRDEQALRPGVLMFVFYGHTCQRSTQPSAEGTLSWLPVAELARYPLVDDLYELLPRILHSDAMVYGHYTPQPSGTMKYELSLPTDTPFKQ